MGRKARSAPVRGVIVGAGLMGRWHGYYARRAGGEIAAIVDPDATRREDLRRSHPTAGAYDDLGACLRDVAADVAHICTPPASHVQIARTAIEAGVHALVEKPLAPTASETASLVELAERMGVLLSPVHQFPFQRGFRRVVAGLGRLGELVEISFVTYSAGGVGLEPERRRELLFEILPHPLSLFSRLLPLDVAEVPWRLPTATADELELYGEHEGTLLRARIGLRARPTRNQLTIAGDRATAHLDIFHDFAIVVSGERVSRATKLALPFVHGGKLLAAATANAARRAAAREPAYPGLHALVSAFYAAARGEAAAPSSSAEMIAIARVIDRLRAP
jgi:predicted dehydrogenase